MSDEYGAYHPCKGQRQTFCNPSFGQSRNRFMEKKNAPLTARLKFFFFSFPFFFFSFFHFTSTCCVHDCTGCCGYFAAGNDSAALGVPFVYRDGAVEKQGPETQRTVAHANVLDYFSIFPSFLHFSFLFSFHFFSFVHSLGKPQRYLLAMSWVWSLAMIFANSLLFSISAAST